MRSYVNSCLNLAILAFESYQVPVLSCIERDPNFESDRLLLVLEIHNDDPKYLAALRVSNPTPRKRKSVDTGTKGSKRSGSNSQLSKLRFAMFTQMPS
jgi:hypothetical protein